MPTPRARSRPTRNRALALWLLFGWAWLLAIGPALHQVGHRNDHYHLPAWVRQAAGSNAPALLHSHGGRLHAHRHGAAVPHGPGGSAPEHAPATESTSTRERPVARGRDVSPRWPAAPPNASATADPRSPRALGSHADGDVPTGSGHGHGAGSFEHFAVAFLGGDAGVVHPVFVEWTRRLAPDCSLVTLRTRTRPWARRARGPPVA